MLKPYLGTEDNVGAGYYTSEELTELFTKFEKMNRRVMTHAVGDRAVREVLNAIEATKKANPNSTIRDHLTHNTLAHPDDINRFSSLDLVFEVSPVMVLSPAAIEMFDNLLGRDILLNGWNLRDAVDSGAKIAIATDWKVSPLDPWHAMGWVVSRFNLDYPDMKDIAPEKKLSIEEAIKAYTIGAAYALAKEKEIGQILLRALSILTRRCTPCQEEVLHPVAGDW